MLQRGGQAAIHMLENVRQVTIHSLIPTAIASGTLVLTDEYDLYGRLPAWGYDHKIVCHGDHEHARDEDGDDPAFWRLPGNSIRSGRATREFHQVNGSETRPEPAFAA